MSKVTVTREFTMPLDEVREGMEKIGKTLHDEYGMAYEWAGKNRVNFSHKAGRGHLEIDGNRLVLELKLGMLYAAMAPMIKNRLNEFAEKHIS